MGFLIAGLLLLGFDVARLTMTGVALLGTVLIGVGVWRMTRQEEVE